MTSLVARERVFLLTLDIDARCVKSMAIDITRKVTEVVFQDKDVNNASKNGAGRTLHNNLLDRHKEV